MTIDGAHITEADVFGLPVVPFEGLQQSHPPDDFDMFIALGYRRMNHLREERCATARELGSTLVSHVSPRASTWPELIVGDNCLILDQVMIHPYVTIGDDVIVWSGAHIGHNSTVGDHCFIASRAAVSGNVRIGHHTFLGTNCTVRDGLTIGPENAIGAGVVVTRDSEPGQVFAPPVPRILPGTSDRLPRL